MTNNMQVCTFTINNQQVGMPIDVIREIIIDMPIRPVPLTGVEVQGLMNLRGQIIMVLDLRALMGLPVDNNIKGKSHIIIGEGDNLSSLLVDSIGDIIEIDIDLCTPPLPTFSEKYRKLFTYIYTASSEEYVLIIDKSLSFSTELMNTLCAQQ